MKLTLIFLFLVLFGMLLSICFVLPSILFLKISLLFVLRVLHHLAVFGGLPITWTWKFFWSGLFADIMGKSGVIYVGSGSSEMGFGGGVEGRSDIVTMDGNPPQGGPSTSTPHTDGANQAPSEADVRPEAPFDLNLPAPAEPASTSDPLEAENRQLRQENLHLEEEPRRNEAEIRGEALRLNNRIALFREFEEGAERLLNQSNVRIDDPEDVRRVSNIFIDDDWDNRKLRQVVNGLSNPTSKTAREFINEFIQFRDGAV